LCIFILISVFGLSSRIHGRHQKDSNTYQNIGLNIVNQINNKNSGYKIIFSDAMNKDVNLYGYEKFLSYYGNKFGKIVVSDPPIILPMIAKFQIRAEKGNWSMIVGFDTDGSVCSLQFVAPDPIIPVPERNSKPMRLPFRGEWSVEMGGSTPEQNYHVNQGRSLRCAIDFTMNSSEGKAFKGDGTNNKDYFSYGQDVLAVADGEVVTVIDGTPDNQPFTINPMSYAGNLVILKHANNEYSRYGHLKKNSICVKVGQQVVSSQVIAQCGNSGNSALPHLHFDITNSDVSCDATGFTPHFQNVLVRRNGSATTSADYTALRFDFVRSRD
jgi:hypothetical protein